MRHGEETSGMSVPHHTSACCVLQNPVLNDLHVHTHTRSVTHRLDIQATVFVCHLLLNSKFFSLHITAC